MKYNVNRLIILYLIIGLLNCMNPRLTHKTKRFSRTDRVKAEKVIRKTENRYRTLDVKNLLSYIRWYLGTPYKYGGASPAGFDCSGFVVNVFKKAFNIELPHSTEEIFNNKKTVSVDQLIVGDLVFFGNESDDEIAHVGIYLMDLKFVHASSAKGVIVSDLSNIHYKKRFKGARRVANLILN